MKKPIKAMCLSTIDEINQYLNGNVTQGSLINTLDEFKEYLESNRGYKYHWNEDTLMHFYFGSMYLNDAELAGDITNFVHAECSLEDKETEEDLVYDLYRQVKNYDPSVDLIKKYDEKRR